MSDRLVDADEARDIVKVHAIATRRGISTEGLVDGDEARDLAHTVEVQAWRIAELEALVRSMFANLQTHPAIDTPASYEGWLIPLHLCGPMRAAFGGAPDA